MSYAVAVIDIGMTNKKVAVYDENLHQLDAVYKTFEPLKVREPDTGVQVEAHDLAGMEDWFFEQLRIFAQKYSIKALSVTTHGATFVCIDKDGKVCVPSILYTHEPGEQFQNEFYKKCGSKADLQRSTYTPPFGSLINPAKGIMYVQKHFAAEFAKTRTILNFPQYWGYVFTGIAGTEPTYCGCHSYLWDHKKSDWSPVTDTLGIRPLLPTKYKNTCEALGTLTEEAAKRSGLDRSTVVTMGIHDSNASLLPYLAKDDTGDFVLNSTGTWCVCMHPQDELAFNEDDIGKIVFFNQSAFRRPIKTAIFVGGMEFDTYISLYKKVHNTEQFPSFDFGKTQEVLNEKDTFLMPEIVAGSGQFTGSKPGIRERGTFYSLEDMQKGVKLPHIIRDEQRFFALLDLSLVIQTETALRRSGLKKGTKVFTEGGFRKNKLYNALLASALPENEIFLTGIAEATACGAAIAAVMALSGKPIRELGKNADIAYTAVEKAPVTGYEAYKKAWMNETVRV